MREVKLKKTNSDTKDNNLMFLFKKAAPSTHSYKCLICKDCCISPADKVCACWPSGNMCFFKLPHVRLALRKHVNKHNKTQSHLPAKRNSSTGTSAAPVALWRFKKKKKEVNYELETCGWTLSKHILSLAAPLSPPWFFWLLLHPSYPKLSFFPPALFYFFAAVIFLGAPQLCVHGQEEPFAPAWIPWIAIMAPQKHITKHN